MSPRDVSALEASDAPDHVLVARLLLATLRVCDTKSAGCSLRQTGGVRVRHDDAAMVDYATT